MSSDLRSLAIRANELVSNNQLDKAVDCYRKICELDKNNVDALINYGSLCVRTGDHRSARDAFERACSLGRRYGKQHEYLLNLLVQLNDLHGAISRLKAFADLPNTPHNLHSRAGMLYGRLGAFDDAINAFMLQIALYGEDLDTCYGLASAYQHKNDFSTAIEYYHKAISHAPGDAAVHNSLGACLELAGDMDSAIKQYSKAVDADARHAPSRYNLANACFCNSEFEQAQTHFLAASRLLPDNAQVFALLGVCNYYLNRYDLAKAALRKALSLEPTNLTASINLANCLIAEGSLEDAETLLNQAYRSNPSEPEPAAALSQLYEKQGETDKAMRCIKGMIRSHPSHPDVASAFALASRTPEQQEEALLSIQRSLEDINIWPGKRISLHYIAGKILDRKKRYDQAFSHYRKANELQSYRYDHHAHLMLADRIKHTFPTHTSTRAIEIPERLSSPIFIIGMPRSGTTMVEQILACHPDVCAAGELQHIERLLSSAAPSLLSLNGQPATSATLEQEKLPELARVYLEQATSDLADAAYFTDKMPHNFQHVGFIKSMFKNVRVIHVTRNSMDNCLSVYFSNFNKRHRYSSNLGNIQLYYHEFYLDLMTHWHTIYGDSILRIAYEDIVDDQETQTRHLLEFAGLPWDERCLDFHVHTRNVVTPSYDQVRQPLYNSSVGRWRNYETHLTEYMGLPHASGSNTPIGDYEL